MKEKTIKKKQKTLKNGFKIVSLNDPSAITTTALLVVKTGSKYESAKENGLSHFLEHLFFKGTKKRPSALELSSDLDSLGGEYNAFTGKEYTGYYVKVAAGRVTGALDILSDMLLSPLFPKQEITREKGVVIEEIKMYNDNPLMHVEDVFETCLYGDTPAGWEVIGSRKNVRQFSHSLLLDYYKRQYGASSMTLIISGAVTEKDISSASKLFSKALKNPWQVKQKVSDKQSEARVKIVRQKIDQANLSLGVRAVPVDHPQEATIKLLSFILGGSMSSRLFVSLRERRGLAYYIKTINEQYSDSAYLTTQAGVPLKKLKESIELIKKEYKLIAQEGIDEKELKRTKDMAIGRLKLNLEGSDDLANWYGKQAVMRKKFVSPEQYIKKIEGISLKEINQVASDIFKQPLNLAIIANVSPNKQKEFLKLLEN